VRAGRVDDRLLVRQQVRRKLVELASKTLTPAELEKALLQLAARGPYAALGALMLLTETTLEREASVAAGLLIALDDEQAVDSALGMLHRRDVADVAKGQIVRFLAAMGYDLGEIMTPTVFRDMNKMASDSMEQLLADIASNANIIGYILEDFAGFPPEMQYSYVQDLARTRDSRVIPLLEVLARGDDEVIAAEAIKGLGAIVEERSLGALQNIRERAPEGFIQRLADREARRLSFKGIRPEFSPPPELGDPLHVVVTGIDGKGCRIVWVSRFQRKNRGKLMAVSFLLSLNEGLKDCYGSVDTTRRESTKMCKSLGQKHPLVEGDMAYATLLLRDALFSSQQRGQSLPPQWAYWQNILWPGDLTPQPYVPEPPLGVSESTVETSAPELLTLEELAEWYEEDPLVYDAAEEIIRVGKRFRSSRAKNRAADDVLRKVATALFQPRLPEIIRRLDLTSEFLSRRGKLASARSLLQVSRELQSGEPPERNSFLRNVLILSVRVAEHNLQSGFDLRREPEIFD